MAMYEVKLHMDYQFADAETPTAINVFTYTDSPDPTVTGSVDALLDAFEADILPQYQALLPSASKIVLLQGRDVYNPYDFQDRVLDTIGAQGGQPLPPFNAVLLRSDRLAIGVRRLRKFIPAPTENGQEAGIISGPQLLLYEALANALGDEITDVGTSRDFRLVLARKERYIISGSSPIRYAWRYFDTLTEQLAWTLNVTDLYVEPRITTMRSRMFSRGT